MKTSLTELRPILSALSRSSAGAFLVALQIAFALAVIANTLFVVVQRIQTIGRDTGMDPVRTVFVESSIIGRGYSLENTVRDDLLAVRALPGVLDAGSISVPPISGDVMGVELATSPTKHDADAVFYYDIDDRTLETLGVQLLSGRNFTAAEIEEGTRRAAQSGLPSAVILTRDLAQTLFGTEQVVGRTVYDEQGRPVSVVGVVANVMSALWSQQPTRVAFFPRLSAALGGHYYAVRAERERHGELIDTMQRTLERDGLPRAITQITPLSTYLDVAYSRDRQLIFYLVILMTLMLAISVMGIAALTSFHVTVRTKQIGTRRAVGARRIDIIRYFMLGTGW